MNEDHKYRAIHKAPFGMLGIICEDNALKGIEFLPADTMFLPPKHLFAQLVCKQLAEYFVNPDFQFSLPLSLNGTDHQSKLWQAISAIPRGKTRQYGELAREIISSPRAVGQACGANPVPVVIPCHRVVGKSGIGGFAHQEDGFELGIKRWLLAHEQH